MSAFEKQPCIGLFGTCGDSTFRQDLFIPEYDRLGIPYFNPQLPAGTWRPECSADEADHLAFDVVQCWPVTGETYGAGSLTEQGYSILASLRSESPYPKFVLPMIELELNPSLDDVVAMNESIRARKLAVAHMALNASPNVFMVTSLEQMLETSVTLYGVAQRLVEATIAYNPAYRRYIQGRREREAYRVAMEAGVFGENAQIIANRS
ncbi:hypothetical protein IPL85_04405 [Candidatus Saccharibacteria bacterium]|nr:MAG: hypothetical protein IPL85_04405 [Candidatus Saccharibacteria bacterium]